MQVQIFEAHNFRALYIAIFKHFAGRGSTFGHAYFILTTPLDRIGTRTSVLMSTPQNFYLHTLLVQYEDCSQLELGHCSSNNYGYFYSQAHGSTAFLTIE